jgi:prevent-host-death family protein
MIEVGVYEAKTQLPKLLERVEAGERFTITRHGKPVAELAPVAGRDAQAVRDAVTGLRGMRRAFARRGVTLASLTEEGETLRDLIHEGHRY